MFELFQYSFIWIALAIGVSLSISSAFLSPFLVFNNKSLVADGLSHVAFTGVVFGVLFSNQPLLVAIPFTIIASMIITFLSTSKKLNSDSAIGIVASVALAIGLIVISLSNGFNQTISSLLMGNIFTTNYLELFIAIISLLLIIFFVVFFYHQLLSLSYDAEFAKFKKIKVNFLNYTLAALTGLLVIIGVRTVGVLMTSAFIIFPSLIARHIRKDFKSTILFGTIFAIVIVFLSIFISHHLAIPSGSTMIIIFAVSLLIVRGISFLRERKK